MPNTFRASPLRLRPPTSRWANLNITPRGSGPYPDSSSDKYGDFGDYEEGFEIIDVYERPTDDEELSGSTNVVRNNNVQRRIPAEVRGDVPGYRSAIGLSFGEHTLQGLRVNRPFYSPNGTGGGTYYYVYAFSVGTLESITHVEINGQAYGGSGTNPYVVTSGPGTVWVYNGEQTSIDTTLQSLGLNPAYGTYHAGKVYAVLGISALELGSSPPRLAIKGEWEKNIYDPRGGGSTGYTNNAALAVRHFIVNVIGGTMDDTASETVYDRADELIGGKLRHTVNMSLRNEVSKQAWLQVLCTYAGCWAINSGGVYTLVGDAPKDPIGTIAAKDVLTSSYSAGGRPAPTNIEVKYEDLLTGESKSQFAVPVGGGQDVVSISMPGINDAGEAQRFGETELAKKRLREDKATFVVSAEGVQYQPGDVYEISDPEYDIGSKPYLVLSASESNNYYTITAVEWQNAVFSDSFEVVPDNSISLDDPFDIDTVTVEPVIVTSEYNEGMGSVVATVNWAEPSFQHISGYEVVIVDTDASPDRTDGLSNIAGRSNTSATFVGLLGATNYEARISPFNDVAIGVDTTQEAFLTPDDLNAPTAPATITVEFLRWNGVRPMVNVTWDASPESDVAAYVIESQYDQGTWLAEGWGSKIGLETNLSGVLLPPNSSGVDLKVRIKAIDRSGNESGFTESAEITFPVTGDLAAANITNDSSCTGATLKDALDNLDTGDAEGPFQVADGSVSAPAYSFASDTDMGWYRSGADTIAYSSGNNTDFTFNGSGQLLIHNNGDATNPAVTWFSDSNTGFYRGAEDIFGISTGGSEALRLNGSQQAVFVGGGDHLAPDITFSTTELDTGFYRDAVDTIGVSTAGIERVTFDTTELTLVSTYGLRLDNGDINVDLGNVTVNGDVDTVTLDASGLAEFSGGGTVTSSAFNFSGFTVATTPGLRFGASGPGLYSSGGNLAVTDGASQIARFEATKIWVPQGIVFDDASDGEIRADTSFPFEIIFEPGGSETCRMHGGQAIYASTNGTATLPFYSWGIDDDTGIYRDEANSVSISAGNSQKLKVDSNWDLFDAFLDPASWTPTLQFGGGTTGITYGTRVGKYARIGRMVWLYVRIILTNKGSSTGSATITSVPLTSTTDSGVLSTFNIGPTDNITLQDQLYAYINPNNTTISLADANSGAGKAALNDSDFTNTTELTLSGWYYVD